MFFKQLLTILFVIALSLTLGTSVLAQDSTPDHPSPQSPVLQWLDHLLDRLDSADSVESEVINPFAFLGKQANHSFVNPQPDSIQTISRDFSHSGVDRSIRSAELNDFADRLEDAVSTWKASIQRHDVTLEPASNAANGGWFQRLIDRLENAAPAAEESWLSRLNLSALKHLNVMDMLR